VDGEDAERSRGGRRPRLFARQDHHARVLVDRGEQVLEGRPGRCGPDRVQAVEVDDRVPQPRLAQQRLQRRHELLPCPDREGAVQVDGEQARAYLGGQRLGGVPPAGAWAGVEVQPQRLAPLAGVGDQGRQAAAVLGQIGLAAPAVWPDQLGKRRHPRVQSGWAE
jgi:hypothetical protein